MMAFTLATIGAWSVLDFALSHIFVLSGVGILVAVVACVLLAIFVPGSVALIRTAIGVLMKGLQWLIGTTTGRVILLSAVCLATGWIARGALESSVALRQQLEAQVKATSAATAAATRAQLQALALRDIVSSAERRASDAESWSDHLQDQVDDMPAQLAASDKTAGKPARSFALSAADIAAFARLGAPRAPR